MQGCTYEKSYTTLILKKNLMYIKLRKKITNESYLPF
jgi:hypothetical protein